MSKNKKYVPFVEVKDFVVCPLVGNYKEYCHIDYCKCKCSINLQWGNCTYAKSLDEIIERGALAMCKRDYVKHDVYNRYAIAFSFDDFYGLKKHIYLEKAHAFVEEFIK